MKMNWYDTKCSIFGLRFSDIEINIKRQSNYRFIFETIFIWSLLLFVTILYVHVVYVCAFVRDNGTGRETEEREKKSKQFQFELRHIRLCFICGAHYTFVLVRVPVFQFCALYSLIKRYVCVWVSLALQLIQTCRFRKRVWMWLCYVWYNNQETWMWQKKNSSHGKEKEKRIKIGWRSRILRL